MNICKGIIHQSLENVKKNNGYPAIPDKLHHEFLTV